MEACPLVSVIMNCYNGEEFLREALDSVIAQDYKNWEIVFWDNCSTDKSAEIVRSYNDSRIKYFRGEKHVLLGEARNYAIEKANGDFIAFLDVDDLWMPGKLSVQIKILNKYPEVGLIYSRHIKFSKDAEMFSTNITDDRILNAKNLISEYDVGLSAVIIRTDVVREKDIKFNANYNLIEEFDYFIRIACYANVYYTGNILMKWRLHTNNTTKLSDRWAEEYRIFIESVKMDTDMYPGLDPYLHEVVVKYAISKVFYYIKKNRRILALKEIMTNVFIYPKLLIYIIPTFIGERKYSAIRNLVYKAFRKEYSQ
jgi:glycosyltransferase involved in cell wall biosynthesis